MVVIITYEQCNLEGKRIAMIVGINRYKDKNIQALQGAENDAMELYRKLTDPDISNFEISEGHYLLGEAATFEQIRLAVGDIFWGSGPYDIALFYFSGHAFVDGYGNAYMASYDMIKEEPFLHGINLEELKRIASSAKNISHVVMILDCCYSGLGNVKGNPPELDTPFLDFKEVPKSIIVIASSADDQKSKENIFKHYDGNSHYHGALTFYLLEGLDGKASNDYGIISLVSLTKYLEPLQASRKGIKYYVKFEQISDINIAIAPQKACEYMEKVVEKARTAISDSNQELHTLIDAAMGVSHMLMTFPKNKEVLTLKNKISVALTKYQHAMKAWLLINQASIRRNMLDRPDEFIKLLTLVDDMVFEKIPSLVGTNNESILYLIYDASTQKYEKGKDGIKNFVRYTEQYKIQNIPTISIGKYDDAIKKYDEEIKKDPRQVNAWYGRGNVFFASGNYDEAIKNYNKAIKINPHFVDAWYCKGISLNNLGKYTAAIKCFDNAIEINPYYAEAWQARGDALFESGNYDEAIKNYDKVINTDPFYANAWYSKGIVLYYLRNYDDAISCFDKAIEIDQNYVGAWYTKGDALFESGNYDEAIQCYDKVTEIDSNYIDARGWTNKGNAFYALGNYDKAIELYDRALKKDRKYASAWRNRGLALYKLGNYNDAINNYNKAININPDFVDAWFDKGEASNSLGKYDAAIECYDKAVSIDQNYIDAWHGKGLVLYNLGKYDAAIECYDKAVSIDQNYIDAWHGKGIVLYNLGKYEESIACFDKAINIDRNYAKAWHGKAIALQTLKQFKEALRCADKAIKLDPKDLYSLLVRGYSLQALGKYSEAEQCYNKALDLDPKNINALSDLSLLYSEFLYNYEKALELKRRVLEIDPDNFLAKTNIVENLIKVGRYKEARKYALQVLDESLDTVKQCIIKFLIFTSYLLEGNTTNGTNEFFDYYSKLDKDFKIEEEQWIFRGLIKAINKSSVNVQTRFLLLSLIDLLQGKIDRKKLSFFQEF